MANILAAMSLAKTMKKYAVFQVRPDGNNFHFQAQATGVTGANRPYGFAGNFSGDFFSANTLRQGIQAASYTLKSLANSGQNYALVQARVKDQVIHVQIMGTGVNRPYGAAIDIPVSAAPELASAVNNLLASAS